MARGVTNAGSLCAALLEATGVAVLPGSDFGLPASDLTLRLAYVDFDGAAALHAAGPQVELDSAWLSAHCPRVVEGIDKMSEWVQG